MKGESLNAHMHPRINGHDTLKYKSLKYAIYWVSTGHILSDSNIQIYNPRAGMTAKEKLMEETTEYLIEDDETDENTDLSDIF